MESVGTIIPESRISHGATFAGGLLSGIAAFVLTGWVLHIPRMASLVSGLATMKVNTAAGFLLIGVALIRRDHRDSLIYSAGTLAIAFLTFLEYLFGTNFGIDQLLFRDPYPGIDPGRMSQITTVGLIMLASGTALMRSHSLNIRRLSMGFGLVAGVIGAVAALGYSYDTRALYQVRPYTSVSIITAVAFMIAALGVSCANPRLGPGKVFNDTAGGAMLRRLLPAAMLVPYVVGFAVWIAHKQLGWEMGFSFALLVAATMLSLVLIMFSNAKRLEQEDLKLREINRTLEERVRQRTLDLEDQIAARERTQQLLDQQRSQMITASKLTSLGEMAGGVAHEINSPLNIIQARASDLQEIAESQASVDSGIVLKATGSILRTGERIMSIVRGLRTFARDGTADPFERTSVQIIIDDTLSLCRERFAVNGIRVEVSIGDPNLHIECRRVQISQILINLLNNAFDAVKDLPERWIALAVSDAVSSVEIDVTDSGPGIPEEIAEKVLQPFFTTKPIGKGSGLGLSVSSAIAQTHHGNLRIISCGKGTHIVLSLPKQQSSAPGEKYAHA